MASSTDNLSLIKPDGTDKIRIAQINQNMDTIDAKIGAVGATSLQAQNIAQDGAMAIVSTGNTHGAISAGQFVYVRNHGTLSEGLYTANSAIAANVTLSSSNLTAVSGGGFNALKTTTDTLNSQISYKLITDFNEFIPTGTTTKHIYGNCTGGSAANAPISGDNITYRAEAIGTTTYFTQEALVEYATTGGNRGRKFIRQCLNSEFTPWVEINERSLTQTIATNSSKTFTLNTYGMCLVKIGGYRDASCGVALLCRSGSNTLVTKWLGTAPSNITISMSNDGNGTVTITNGDTLSAINVWTERLTGTFIWS